MLTRILFSAVVASVLFWSAPVTAMGAVPYVSLVCSIEQWGHEGYIAFVAPRRPAAAVAREARFYANAMQVCSMAKAGLASSQQVDQAIASSQAARQ